MRVRVVCGIWPKALAELIGEGTSFDGGRGCFCYTELNGYSAVLLDELAKVLEAVEAELLPRDDFDSVALELVRPGVKPNANLPVDPLNWTACILVVETSS